MWAGWGGVLGGEGYLRRTMISLQRPAAHQLSASRAQALRHRVRCITPIMAIAP